ncbi:MAG: DUF4143 domain-containing protein [Bacteroidales bacterium]|jgi:predicted AAA+ superfamily ATPase
MKNYKKRIADRLLKEKLGYMGAVLIKGAKWCGKTTTAEQVAGSVLYVDEPSKKGQNQSLAKLNPNLLLEGKTPRLLDEWQVAPELWDAVRFEVDHRDNGVGQFILTGSAAPLNSNDKEKISHSGTGRIAWLIMRPMTLYESGESNGTVSIKDDLFTNNSSFAAINSLELEDIARLMCRGGWPGACIINSDKALKIADEYITAVTNIDISRVDNVKRSPEFTKRLMRSYARHQSTQASIATIYADIVSHDNESLSEETITSYINALKQLYVIEDVQAWNPNLRSKTAIRTSDTRYYTDPSLATASLGVGSKDLINDLKTMGLIFETLVIRDLRVYAEANDGQLYHYRDKSGLECDAVIYLKNGTYGLIEIKLGGEESIKEGSETLKRLSEKIDTDRMNAPSFLAVVTGVGNYAYRREDGIFVVPIGCLKD